MNKVNNILITGAAGFIGYHLASCLLKEGENIIGIDNLNNYYDPSLKNARLNNLNLLAKKSTSKFNFIKGDISNKDFLEETFKKYTPNLVVNLAAQAGVRYSISNPSAYIESNLVGFANIIENCRNHKVDHLVYASSSSVYGGNTKLPFSEKDSVNHPISLYAATKRANELIAHSYSHLYDLPATGLRFFTVYGPFGRPDMALFLFTKAIIEGKKINIFNNGEMIRDFTYVDDIVESLKRVIYKPATKNIEFNTDIPDPSTSFAKHRVFNIGNSKPVRLMEFIENIENCLGIEAKKNYMPMQPGDVSATAAETETLESWINFKPNTTVKEGVKNFIGWYKEFYKI